MQEACKLIWTRCLVAPDSLSTPTLSNLPPCPSSSSDTPHLSATQLFFIYNFSVFHSVLLIMCVTCVSRVWVNILSYRKTPAFRSDLLGSTGARRVVTMVTWCQQLLTIGTKPLQDEWFMSDKQAADVSGRGVYAAAIWKGFLSTRPRERKGDLGL